MIKQGKATYITAWQSIDSLYLPTHHGKGKTSTIEVSRAVQWSSAGAIQKELIDNLNRFPGAHNHTNRKKTYLSLGTNSSSTVFYSLIYWQDSRIMCKPWETLIYVPLIPLYMYILVTHHNQVGLSRHQKQ